MPPSLPLCLQKLARAHKTGGLIVSSKLLNEMRRLHRAAGDAPSSRSATGIGYETTFTGRRQMPPVSRLPLTGQVAAAVMGASALKAEALRARRQGVGAEVSSGRRSGVPAAALRDVRRLARAGR